MKVFKSLSTPIVKKIEEQFVSGRFTDFLVQVDDKEFRIHKSILAERSPVFEAMVINSIYLNFKY